MRAALIGLLGLCPILCGCSAYLHSPARASATADLKTKFGQLSTPAYFDAQDKNLKDFAGREDHAVAEFLVASRNYRLLNVIEPAAAADPALNARDRLRKFVREDLEAAVGQDSLTPHEVQSFTTKRFTSRLADSTMRTNLQQVDRLARNYRGHGGELPTGCDAVLANPSPNHANPVQADDYAKLVRDCGRLKKRQSLVDGCDPMPQGGALAVVCTRIREFANDKSDEQRVKELKAAEVALKKAAEAKPDPGSAKQAQDFIDSLQELPDNEKLQGILTQLDALFGSELQQAVDDVNRTGKAALTRYSDPIIRALVLFGAIDAVADETKPADKSSALLIGLAKVRHDLDVVNIDIAARKGEAALLRDQVAALHNQVYYLGRAQAALDGGHLDEALNHFVYSVNKGQIPYRVTEFRFIQVQRSTALKHAKATEADYRALLQPAIDQLAAYGEGGIKAETIADILSGLPAAIPVLKD